LLGAELDGPRQGEPGTVRPLQEIAVGRLVGLGRRRPLVVAPNGSAGAMSERAYPLQLVVQPVDGGGPLALELAVGVQHVCGCRARPEQGYQALDALVRTLLVVVLAALDRVEQALSVWGLTLEGVVNAVVLPGVLEQQHVQQEVHEGAQLVRVGVGDLPEELAEHCRRELGVLPRAEAQQLGRVLGPVGVLYHLLHVAGTGDQGSSSHLWLDHHEVVWAELISRMGVGQGGAAGVCLAGDVAAAYQQTH
ncbi:unnamed protein product, partial [Ixodes pacificus]